MALQSIEPKYEDWINRITPDNIYTILLEIQNNFNNILNDILHSTISDKLIIERGNDIRKELLYIEIYKNLMISRNDVITNEAEFDVTLEKMKKNIQIIDKYETRNLVLGQKKSLDILTLITLIFLPIGAIVGYFGMNFGSMGNPIGNNKGILNVKYGQGLVFALFFISIGITLLIIQQFYNFKLSL